jgi:hypothetical protein
MAKGEVWSHQRLRWTVMTPSMTGTSISTPRTLTQMLRGRDDADIARLLQLRPDLAVPPPTDFSQVASRATTRHSVTSALQLLTAFQLWVAARAAAQPSAFTASDLVVEGVRVDDVEAALEHLLDLSLVWGDKSSLRPVRAMAALVPQVDLADPPPAQPPPVEWQSPPSAALVDKVAAGSVFEFVRRIDVLIEHCDHQPAKVVRRGGLANRDVRILASLLDLSSALAIAHLEIAQSAGLLGLIPRGSDEVLIPAEGYDTWQELPLTEQWAVLVEAWLLHHPASGPWWLKRLCLQAFGEPADAVVVAAADLRPWLAWQRPRRHASADREALTMLDQAAWLGLTGLGARSSFLLVDFSAGDAAAADAIAVNETSLSALLPARVDQVVVQADLTAIAPGPLSPEAARDLGALADVESRGGATVYRFSTLSLQRAQRLGWSSSDILGALERRSATALPQPLTYLIRDLDRQVPVGYPAPQGYQPRLHRLPQRAPATSASTAADVDELTPEAVSAIIAALRHDEPDPERTPSDTGNDTVFGAPKVTLSEAVETGELVWFGHVDSHGTSGERVVIAQSIDDGILTARDVKTDDIVTIPLHRITAAHIMRSDG